MSDSAISPPSETNTAPEENGVGGISRVHGSTSVVSDVAAASTNVTIPDANDALIPESLHFVPNDHHGSGLHMPYSAYASGDGSAWTAVMDPSLIAAGFGFPGSNLMPGQYIVGSEMIWNQDPLLMGYQFLNPIPVEPVSDVQIDQNNQTDSAGQITPAFNAMSVNGSGQRVDEAVPITVTSSAVDVGENVSSNSVPVTPSAHSQNSAPQPEKPKSWAAIASQPAKPRVPPAKHHSPSDSVVVETGKKLNQSSRQIAPQTTKGPAAATSNTNTFGDSKNISVKKIPPIGGQGGHVASKGKNQLSGIVGKLYSQNKYNPTELSLDLTNARYFVIKSYAEDDIHRSIKYNMWTSTEHGNRRLDQAFKEQKGRPVYLLYSVNGSGHFCGMAQMKSEVDFHNITGVWAQDKWKGRFDVKWLYVKDVPNSQLRHIRLENNENKPVTNSRDTQEILGDKGKQLVKIVHSYLHTTSIFDDFEHYEKKQLEDSQKRTK